MGGMKKKPKGARPSMKSDDTYKEEHKESMVFDENGKPIEEVKSGDTVAPKMTKKPTFREKGGEQADLKRSTFF